MSDKLSSPSASSNNGRSPNSRSSGNGTSDEPYLVVQRQPPKYCYSNESFDVDLQLEIPKSASPPQSRWGPEIELVASVHHQNTGRECGAEALLITQPSRIVLVVGRDGVRRCKVTCMIRIDSIRRDEGASLELRFSPRPGSSPPIRAIAGTGTNPIALVNYKIKLSMDDEWGPVWYKDEGGRDKSMEVFAAIYDKDGQIKTGEQMPLSPILCYQPATGTPVRVLNQEILRTLGASKLVIDKDTGQARVRFRVEDVSKNHQAQDFVLEVGTDPKAKGFKDVAPAFTPPVNVRSKRNKRSRNQVSSRSGSESGRRSSPVAGRSRSSGYDDQPDLPLDGADVPRLRNAMRSVLNWADEVVNGLYPLQWQMLGYAQHPDGTADYARPYHNMPNPNPCINRVLGMYSENVRESLRVLLTAVEKASSRSDDDSAYVPMPMVGPAPRPPPEDMYGMVRSPPGAVHGPPGMSLQAIGRRPGMHPGEGFRGEGFRGEGFRERPPQDQPMYQPARPSLPQMHQVPPAAMNPFMRPGEGEIMPLHAAIPSHRDMAPLPPAAEIPLQRQLGHPEEESRENEVEYILAKQYKALRTGERLGFPAYSANKEILGFYREPKMGMNQFTPISRHRNDFGPLEIMQATEILEEAIAKKSDMVHALKDWGSIGNLLDRALVYEWQKELSGNEPSQLDSSGQAKPYQDS